MPNQVKNILIGIFVVTGIVFSIYIILFMEPKIGDGAKTLKVRFSNISGINIGTRVTLAGKAVGEVEKIEPITGAREDLTDELGRVYFYQLYLKVDSSVEIYNTDEVAIATTGLLGEKSIAIIPKAPLKGVTPKNITNQIIYAQSVEPLENLMHQITTLSDTFEGAINDLDVWFVENRDRLSDAVQGFADSMQQVNLMLESINQQEIISSVKDAIDGFSENMQLIQSSLEEMQDNEMLATFNVILENFASASSSINVIAKDIAEGTGSLGKFIKQDDFYLRLVAVMSKVDTLMNDINNYGILFQYDKHWQRIRTKRAALLSKIDTPKEFKTYFEGEMDNITTSLGRISLLIDKAQDPQEKELMFSSSAFQKDFVTLLKQVEHLLDSLKLYNEKLIDKIDGS